MYPIRIPAPYNKMVILCHSFWDSFIPTTKIHINHYSDCISSLGWCLFECGNKVNAIRLYELGECSSFNFVRVQINSSFLIALLIQERFTFGLNHFIFFLFFFLGLWSQLYFPYCKFSPF